MYRKVIPGPPDLLSGDKGTPDKTDVLVKRGITTSADVIRRTEYGSLIQAFKVGGYLETWDRLFILRSSYVSSISQENDLVIFNDQIYRIDKWSEIDFQAGFVLFTTHVTGEDDVT